MDQSIYIRTVFNFLNEKFPNIRDLNVELVVSKFDEIDFNEADVGSVRQYILNDSTDFHLIVEILNNFEDLKLLMPNRYKRLLSEAMEFVNHYNIINYNINNIIIFDVLLHEFGHIDQFNVFVQNNKLNEFINYSNNVEKCVLDSVNTFEQFNGKDANALDASELHAEMFRYRYMYPIWTEFNSRYSY